MAARCPPMLIELLAAHAQQVLYILGRIVHHAAATYRGDGKTDAKDARIIADQARRRTDLQPVRGADQISVDLRLLTARRTDLICDRVRAINRLRATLLEYFPALERAFDYSKKAPLILLSGHQTPEGIRRTGLTRLAGWLRKRGCRNSAKMAEKALQAANSQHTVLPTQTTGSALVVRLAEQISALDADIAGVDAQITDLFRQHDSADVLLTMPGVGPVLAATFLANIGGNLDAFDSVRSIRCRGRIRQAAKNPHFQSHLPRLGPPHPPGLPGSPDTPCSLTDRRAGTNQTEKITTDIGSKQLRHQTLHQSKRCNHHVNLP